jgi:hypothetical protein
MAKDRIDLVADSVAADMVGDVKYPRVKIAAGNDGEATDVSSTNPLPVVLKNMNGFIDYNNTLPSQNIAANTWTDVQNNGLGVFTNKAYTPENVTELMDLQTGYLDFRALSLGDSVFLRNDITFIPEVNNSVLDFRYVLGSGSGEYTLEKKLGRLDSGAGESYRFSLNVDYIYMGDFNTRDNPVKIQVRCSQPCEVSNAGIVISVFKR